MALMRYYAQYNNSGKLIAIGTGHGGVEITESEYNTLLAEIREKAELVDQLYNSKITIDYVPSEWQEEIQRRVDERIEQDAIIQEEAVSGDEFMTMLEGVL